MRFCLLWSWPRPGGIGNDVIGSSRARRWGSWKHRTQSGFQAAVETKSRSILLLKNVLQFPYIRLDIYTYFIYSTALYFVVYKPTHVMSSPADQHLPSSFPPQNLAAAYSSSFHVGNRLSGRSQSHQPIPLAPSLLYADQPAQRLEDKRKPRQKRHRRRRTY